MSKVAVVFWSGTGCTESMANFVAEGAKEKGVEVDLFSADDFKADMVAEYTGIGFGCPSMGVETLEESEFQPMWDEVKTELAGKKVVLFGSFGWGDGEWMRDWQEDTTTTEVLDVFTCNDAPDADGEEACKKLGALLA